MQASHQLPLTLIFSIIYCCMVGSIPMDHQFPNAGGNSVYDILRLRLLQHTMYNALHHGNAHTNPLATPYCSREFTFDGVVYPVLAFLGPVKFSSCQKFSDLMLLPESARIQLNSHNVKGEAVSWTTTIVVSGFLVRESKTCLPLVKLNEMHAQGRGHENADPEGTCAYIDIQKLPAVTVIPPFLPPDIMMQPAHVHPAPTQSALVPAGATYELTPPQRSTQRSELTLGLDDVLKTRHHGCLCRGLISPGYGRKFIVQEAVRDCTYSQCQKYKYEGFIQASRDKYTYRPRANPRAPKRQYIAVTGFLANSNTKCFQVDGVVRDYGLGICTVVFLRKGPNLTAHRAPLSRLNLEYVQCTDHFAAHPPTLDTSRGTSSNLV